MGGEAKETGLRQKLADTGWAEINDSPRHRLLLVCGGFSVWWTSDFRPQNPEHQRGKVYLHQEETPLSLLSSI